MALKTSDYKKFRHLKGNRAVSKGHLKRLKESIENFPDLLSARPILVNEDFEIIDGQHRFEVCKQLGLPIYYEVEEGLRAKDAIAINTNQRNWGLDDFAQSWANQGNDNYKTYLEVRDEYKFAPSILLAFLRGTGTHGSGRMFREGKFEVGDVREAKKYLDELEDLASLSREFRKIKVAQPTLTILKSPNYDHNRMLQKFTLYGDTFNPYGTYKDIMYSLENVYNFRQREAGITRLYGV